MYFRELSDQLQQPRPQEHVILKSA